MASGYGFDVIPRFPGRTFPVSAIWVRKFCESTRFRAERIHNTGFSPPCSLQEGLQRTIRFEFPCSLPS